MTGPMTNENLGGGTWGITSTVPTTINGVIACRESAGGAEVAWIPASCEKGPTFRFRFDASPPYPVNTLEDRPFRFKLSQGVLFLPFWTQNPTTFDLPQNAIAMFLPARAGFTQVDVSGTIYPLPAEVAIPAQPPGTIPYVMTVTYQ
jgi:hypothetical protein